MTFLVVHAVVYAAVTALLVLLWLMLGGEWAGSDGPLDAARTAGFWPFWVAAVWAVLLVAHAGVTLAVKGWRWRRRRRKRRRSGSGVPAHRPGTRWIAAMFTDIVGSTSLNARMGDRAYSDMLAAHRRTVREVVSDHGGTEVGTQGDGFLVRFDAPQAAVACAVDLQRRLARHREEDDGVPRIRIGLHAGEVIARDGDVVGQMVNVAARVADEASADQVVVTEPVADHAPADLEVDDLGLVELKGLGTPRHLLALRWDA